ncbi:hypothetical protein [Methylobacterium nodulans]|uniref:hypothetical protein n=1 Tax=Methylobacterium nodulans TaxID=114616 RepID=UPI0001618E5E|nr:hypothetical protein [Methylobacterium nodulans]
MLNLLRGKKHANPAKLEERSRMADNFVRQSAAHNWRMHRNDLAGVVDDDQRELERRLARG